MIEAEPAQSRIFSDLMASIGLDLDADEGGLRIVGSDPVASSRYRLGGAATAAIAAQAAGIRKIWRMRSGRSQDIHVELRQAVMPGLRSCYHISQNGHALELFPRSSFAAKDFYRTRDGRLIYILRTPMYAENLLGTLEVLQCAYGADAMSAAIAGWDAVDLEDALAERRLVGVVARDRQEWLAHPQGAWLAARPPVEIEKIGDSDPVPFGRPAARPLSGLRVLDIAHVLAGPVTARILAEQGADVLHVSSPHQLDANIICLDTGLGKRSANIDLDRSGDVDRTLRLASDADVVVQSWRPGSLARRGLSPERVAAGNPGVIYVSVSAYGSGGPWAGRGGYEPVGQVACGLAMEEGSADCPRLSCVGTLNDYLTAYLAAAGVTAALIRRAREGGSYHVKASLTRSSMWVQELGALPRESWPDGDLPFIEREEDFHERETAFGRLRVAKPIARFSDTPAFWANGPEPFGASAPEWTA